MPGRRVPCWSSAGHISYFQPYVGLRFWRSINIKKDARGRDTHVGVRHTCGTCAGAFWRAAKTYQHQIRRSQYAEGVARKMRRRAEQYKRLKALMTASSWWPHGRKACGRADRRAVEQTCFEEVPGPWATEFILSEKQICQGKLGLCNYGDHINSKQRKR